MKNKTIQLVAMGNALVDMQFRVSDELLKKLPVVKGEMRLVDEQEQISIINHLVNIIPNRCSGGSATNTIDAFAKFGGKAAYLTCVGDDANGKYYYNELKNDNILFKNNFIADVPTGTCLVLITPDGERSMLTCLGASKHFSIDHLDEELIASSEWLYIEGYKFSETSGAESIAKAIEIAKANNTKIAISASDAFIINSFRANFMEAVKHSDLLFCNVHEAQTLTSTTNSEDAYCKLKEIVPNYVFTKGNKGSTVLFNGLRHEFGVYPVDPIDTTGAGDMFAGAFLYGVLNFDDGPATYTFAGILASYSAALVVSQLGARYFGSFKKLIKDALPHKK